jgi:hypothetical protein
LHGRHEQFVIVPQRRADVPIALLQCAICFVGIDAGSLAEAEGIKRREKTGGIHSLRYVAKKVVAGIRDGVMQLEGVIDPFMRASNLEIIAIESATALNALVICDDTRTQRHEACEGLNRRARREGLLKG